ncbi:LexA family protein [Alistipes timonensis]|uniref:LexA family protein n=1 Tax=Alistipes timonensis TaxID=1465754 RepID=UPI0028FCE852|nr:S24 family peptidase [Alistipes timonensis]
MTEELIPNPVSTFFGKVRGISLIDDDIEDSDSVIVDRMLEPRWGDLAVCVTSEGFTMKYVEVHDDGEIWLMPGNKDYAPIRITGENERLIWGIVTHSIRQLRRLQAAVDEVNGPLNLDSRLVVLGAELTGQNNTRLHREMLSKCPSTKWSDRIDIAV